MTEYKKTAVDATSAYLTEIKECMPLKRVQEAELARRVRTGDAEAINQLVTANLRFAVKIANEYADRGMTLIELVSEANCGLIEAAGRFDERKGHKFITYAVWWIRQAILKALAENGHIVRQPLNRLGDLRRSERARDHWRGENNGDPSDQVIAVQTGLSTKRLRNARDAGQVEISLDAPLDSDMNKTKVEILADERPVVDELIMKLELAERLGDGLKTLKPREVQILRDCFGLDGSPPMTLEAVGEMLGLTRERVRQVRNNALAKLRKTHGAVLREFVLN